MKDARRDFERQEMDGSGVNAYLPHSKDAKKKEKWMKVAATVGLGMVIFIGGAATTWFSLDPDIRTLVKIKQAIDVNYYESIDNEAFYDALFNAVNGQLDPYSYYMKPEVYKDSSESLNGRRIDFGVTFDSASIRAGKMMIAKVSGNSPAEEAGLRSGSYIVGFGRTETEITDSENYQELNAFLMELEANEPFCLHIKMGEETKIITMAQRTYVENYVFYRSKTTSYRFVGKKGDELAEGGVPLSILPEDTAYIRLVRFGNNSVKPFEDAMSVFKQENKKHLVLDLRDNGGGYMSAMQGISSYFCKNSKEFFPVVAIADYGERQENYLASGNVYWDYFDEDSRIYILADNGSASASECLMGVMIEYGATRYEDICLFTRGKVTKTYGKGIMQSHFPISASGDMMKLTTAKMCWPVTGQSIHGRGVLPEDGTKTMQGGLDEEELLAALAQFFSNN